MKLLMIVLVIGFVLITVGIWWIARSSQHGSPPGLVNGKLAPCPQRPNCITSETFPDRIDYIAPINTEAISADVAFDTYQQALKNLGGEVSFTEQNYLAATFTSALFGFVDDVEVRQDSQSHQLHYRSASRVGHYDFGANRKRLRLLFDEYNNILVAR